MTDTTDAREGQTRPDPIRLSKDHVWPLLIIVGLALVLAVNAAFIWIAVTGADPVVPSYNAGER